MLAAAAATAAAAVPVLAFTRLFVLAWTGGSDDAFGFRAVFIPLAPVVRLAAVLMPVMVMVAVVPMAPAAIIDYRANHYGQDHQGDRSEDEKPFRRGEIEEASVTGQFISWSRAHRK